MNIEPRYRRLLEHLFGRSAQFPLKDGARGTELVTSATGPLATDPSRGLTVLVGDGVEITSHSPFAIRAALDALSMQIRAGKIAARLADTSIQETKGGLIARPTVDQVSSPKTNETLDVLLNRLEAASNAADAALDVRLDALEGLPVYARSFLLMGA